MNTGLSFCYQNNDTHTSITEFPLNAGNGGLTNESFIDRRVILVFSNKTHLMGVV
jgi:hypothetical protein